VKKQPKKAHLTTENSNEPVELMELVGAVKTAPHNLEEAHERLKRLFPSTIAEAKDTLDELREFSGVASPIRHFAMQVNAAQVLLKFESDPAKFRAWFERWSEAPDLVFMRYLLWAAQDSGKYLHVESMANKKHSRNREARQKAYAMWEILKAEGLSKNAAAPKIATAVNLAESSIRKILQGA
jgi:hypothetical protein